MISTVMDLARYQKQEETSNIISDDEHYGQLQLFPASNSESNTCNPTQTQESDDDRQVTVKLGPVPLIDLTWVTSQITAIASNYEPEPCHSQTSADNPVHEVKMTCSNPQMSSTSKLAPSRSKSKAPNCSKRKAATSPLNKVSPGFTRTTPWPQHKITASKMTPNCTKTTTASSVTPDHSKKTATSKMTLDCSKKTTDSKVTPSYSRTTAAIPQHKMTLRSSKTATASPLHKVTPKMAAASHLHKVSPKPSHSKMTSVNAFHQSTPCLSHIQTSAVFPHHQAAPCYQQIGAGSPLHKMTHNHSTTERITPDPLHKMAPSSSKRAAAARPMSEISSCHVAPRHQLTTAAANPLYQPPPLHKQIKHKLIKHRLIKHRLIKHRQIKHQLIKAVIPLHHPAPLHPQITAVIPRHQPGPLDSTPQVSIPNPFQKPAIITTCGHSTSNP